MKEKGEIVAVGKNKEWVRMKQKMLEEKKIKFRNLQRNQRKGREIINGERK